MTNRWQLIGIGKAGWHANGVNVSSSGGTLGDYLKDAADGALVYDAEAAEYGPFAKFIIAGPIPAPELEPDGFQPLGGEDNDPDQPRSLDRVGVARYIRLMRERCPGVQFGVVRNGQVEWEVFA